MEADSILVQVALVEVSCGCCGGVYAINKRFKDKCLEDGTCWTCPYCKVSWGYAGVGTAQKLQKQLDAEKRAREEAQARAAIAESAKRAAETSAKRSQTILKNHQARAKNGTCPCCQRTFKQLAAHMAKKHPEYAK